MTDEEYFKIHRASYLNMNAEKIQEQAERNKAIYQATLKELERIKIELMCEYRVIDEFSCDPFIDDNATQVAKPDTRPAITQKQFNYLLSKKVDEFEIQQIEKALSENRQNIYPVQMPAILNM